MDQQQLEQAEEVVATTKPVLDAAGRGQIDRDQFGAGVLLRRRYAISGI